MPPAAAEPPDQPLPVRAGIPRAEDDALEWCLRYSEALIDDPDALHTPPDEAEEIRRLVLTWAEMRVRQRQGWATAAEETVAKRYAQAAISAHTRTVRMSADIPTEAKLALGFEIVTMGGRP